MFSVRAFCSRHGCHYRIAFATRSAMCFGRALVSSTIWYRQLCSGRDDFAGRRLIGILLSKSAATWSERSHFSDSAPNVTAKHLGIKSLYRYGKPEGSKCAAGSNALNACAKTIILPTIRGKLMPADYYILRNEPVFSRQLGNLLHR